MTCYRHSVIICKQKTLRLTVMSCGQYVTCRTASVPQYDLSTMSSVLATVYLYDNCLGTPSLSRWVSLL